MKKNELILVSDIHGRRFWETIKSFVENDKCHAVFLGDYHDPYGFEGITKDESIDNFVDIIEFAKANKGLVTLLLGNHDLTYYNNGKWTVGADRIDHDNYAKLASLFSENEELFKLSYTYSINGRDFLVTHAGVHPVWAKDNLNMDTVNMSPSDISNKINELFENNDKELCKALKCVGYSRGGIDNVGSMVWADCHDFEGIQTKYTQIFSHTQQLKAVKSDKSLLGIAWVPDKPYITGTNVCIDCHDNFYIGNSGDLMYLKGDGIVY